MPVRTAPLGPTFFCHIKCLVVWDQTLEGPSRPAGSSSFLEDEKHSADHQSESDQIIPFQLFLEVQDREYAEDDQGDHLLNRLELRRRIFIMTDPVGRHLKTILYEGNPPAHKDSHPQRRLFVFEMP